MTAGFWTINLAPTVSILTETATLMGGGKRIERLQPR